MRRDDEVWGSPHANTQTRPVWDCQDGRAFQTARCGGPGGGSVWGGCPAVADRVVLGDSTSGVTAGWALEHHQTWAMGGSGQSFVWFCSAHLRAIELCGPPHQQLKWGGPTEGIECSGMGPRVREQLNHINLPAGYEVLPELSPMSIALAGICLAGIGWLRNKSNYDLQTKQAVQTIPRSSTSSPSSVALGHLLTHLLTQRRSH